MIFCSQNDWTNLEIGKIYDQLSGKYIRSCPMTEHYFDPWDKKKKKTKNFMAPFYGWGSTASRLEPLRGGSLLFTTKFPEIPGTHFIDLGRMKG